MKHIIAVLLENEPGALSRVVGLFSARGYNIESLTVAPTEDPSLSRMTIQTTGSDDVIEQITKHLNRLIEVVKVVDLTEGAYTERELMMVQVRAVGKEREDIKGKTVAIIGYGSQGHAHAQNRNDSGVKVIVGLRPGGASWPKVEKAGLKVAAVNEAVKMADVVMILLPDEQIAEVYRKDVEPN